MEPRIDYLKVGRGVYEAMLGLEKYLRQCGLDETLLDLIKLRVSQINGCAYCLDMHWKDLRARGESERGFTGWAPGRSRRITTSANARPWPGLKR